MSASINAVVDPLYCVQQPTTLKLKEELWSLTGDDAAITDETGRIWFKVNPKLFSLREKRTVQDANGNPAFSLRKRTWSMHSTWRMFKGAAQDQRDKLCDIKMDLLTSLSPEIGKMVGTKIKVFFEDGDKEVDFYAKGNFRAKEFKIFKVIGGGEDVQVATISKESRFSSVEAFVTQTQFSAHAYFLEMQPGSDAAFLTALAIVIDENLRDTARGAAAHTGGGRHAGGHHGGHGGGHHGSGSDHEGEGSESSESEEGGEGESASSSDGGDEGGDGGSDGGGWADAVGDFFGGD